MAEEAAEEIPRFCCYPFNMLCALLSAAVVPAAVLLVWKAPELTRKEWQDIDEEPHLTVTVLSAADLPAGGKPNVRVNIYPADWPHERQYSKYISKEAPNWDKEAGECVYRLRELMRHYEGKKAAAVPQVAHGLFEDGLEAWLPRSSCPPGFPICHRGDCVKASCLWQFCKVLDVHLVKGGCPDHEDGGDSGQDNRPKGKAFRRVLDAVLEENLVRLEGLCTNTKYSFCSRLGEDDQVFEESEKKFEKFCNREYVEVLQVFPTDIVVCQLVEVDEQGKDGEVIGDVRIDVHKMFHQRGGQGVTAEGAAETWTEFQVEDDLAAKQKTTHTVTGRYWFSGVQGGMPVYKLFPKVRGAGHDYDLVTLHFAEGRRRWELSSSYDPEKVYAFRPSPETSPPALPPEEGWVKTDTETPSKLEVRARVKGHLGVMAELSKNGAPVKNGADRTKVYLRFKWKAWP